MLNSSSGLPAEEAAAATDEDRASQAFSSFVNMIAYTYVLPGVCIFGIVGNIMNLIVLASRRLRAVTYIYLRALAVADLVCMIFVIGFASVDYAEKTFPGISMSPIYQRYRLHFMLTLINWALGTGTLIVVALSLERLICIVFPLHFRTWNSPDRAIKAIVVAYVVPLLLYLPYGYCRYTGVYQVDPHNGTKWVATDSDVYHTTEWMIYKWFREVMLRFAPILTLTLLNIKIMLAFRKRQQMFKKMVKKKENSKDDTLIFMLLATSVMFLACNVPAAVNLIIITEDRKKSSAFILFRAIANVLEITNHASQFYVFCACSGDYRTTFLLKFPYFQRAYSRGTLRTIVKRTQSIITRDRPTTSDELNPSHSTKALPRPGQVRVADTDTVDVQLASCEEMDRESDERESEEALLRHQIISTPNAGSSTFL